MHKYPWHAHEHVLIEERQALFNATLATLKALIAFQRRVDLRKETMDASKPSMSTLVELSVAIFICPGFSEHQKSQAAAALRTAGHGKLLEDRGLAVRFGGVSKYSKLMPFNVLVLQPGVPDDLVDVSLLPSSPFLISADLDIHSTSP